MKTFNDFNALLETLKFRAMMGARVIVSADVVGDMLVVSAVDKEDKTELVSHSVPKHVHDYSIFESTLGIIERYL